jgi:uncharacterized protein YjbJ (UPF0337 family)
MAEEPDQIRNDIEVTRERLAHDVDRLADKTSPARIAQRRWGGAKSKVRGLSDRVMGSARGNGGAAKDKASDAADSAKDKAADVAGTVRDQAGEIAGQVRDTPAMLGRQTQGNPVAAGLIAFGAGMLVASLLPATAVEQRAGQQLRDHADDLVEPIRQPLAESAQHLREDLGSNAQESVASIRDTAKDAARTTTQTAKDAVAQAKS